MITQLFNSWQTLSKQGNTYWLDRGVSEFVCFLTGPPWGRRSCTRDRSHRWHTQPEGSNRNGTSTAGVLLEDTGLEGGGCWRALLGNRKKGQAVVEALKRADTPGWSLQDHYRISSTRSMARTPGQEQHTDQNSTSSLHVWTHAHHPSWYGKKLSHQEVTN